MITVKNLEAAVRSCLTNPMRIIFNVSKYRTNERNLLRNPCDGQCPSSNLQWRTLQGQEWTTTIGRRVLLVSLTTLPLRRRPLRHCPVRGMHRSSIFPLSFEVARLQPGLGRLSLPFRHHPQAVVAHLGEYDRRTSGPARRVFQLGKILWPSRFQVIQNRS